MISSVFSMFSFPRCFLALVGHLRLAQCLHGVQLLHQLRQAGRHVTQLALSSAARDGRGAVTLRYRNGRGLSHPVALHLRGNSQRATPLRFQKIVERIAHRTENLFDPVPLRGVLRLIRSATHFVHLAIDLFEHIVDQLVELLASGRQTLSQLGPLLRGVRPNTIVLFTGSNVVHDLLDGGLPFLLDVRGHLQNGGQYLINFLRQIGLNWQLDGRLLRRRRRGRR